MPQVTATLSYAETLLTWHESVGLVAFLLLAGLTLFAVFQFAAFSTQSSLARLSRRQSLRSRLTFGLTLVGTIPVLALMFLLTERSAELRLERLSGRITETAGSMAYAVNRYLDKHIAGIDSIASSVSADRNFSRESLTESLLLHHAVYTDFLTMLIANESGDIVTATSLMDGPLKAVEELAGHNVADREYFRAPMSEGRSFVSDPFRGRSLGSDPIVAISAPLTDSVGVRLGVVEGSVNLGAFEVIDAERPQIDGAVMIVVDRSDRVIYASEAAQLDALGSVANSVLIAGALQSNEREPFEFEHGQGGEKSRHVGVYATTMNGWRVFLRAPVEQVAAQMLDDYQMGAILVLLAWAISLLVARAIVRQVSQTTHDMNAAIRSFSIDGAGDEVKTPASTPSEFRPLFRAMRARSQHLRKAHDRLSKSMDAGEALRRQLTQAITLKDVEIAERTAELEEANRELSGLSRTDALTGIPNRREFDTFERRVYRLSAREKTAIAIILMDIDFFKIYNDSLGHQAGDDCLRKVAGALVECATRPMDLVARYGGEEFVAVLGGATLQDALIVAERMRVAVESLQIAHPGSTHEVVTISVGISSTTPNSSEGSDGIVKAADEALYYAKAAGRNCVVFSRDNEYVTYDADDIDLGATGVLQILTSKRAS
jgi:diguanylate cyclase (GGDEF)-like protein